MEGQHDCVEPLPDPGEDACLACAQRHCCRNTVAAVCLGPAVHWVDGDGVDGAVLDSAFRMDGGLGPASCYRAAILARECFEQEVATSSSVEFWYIVAECSDDLLRGAVSIDAGVGFFPFAGDPGTELVECLVGSRPASADDDGGVAETARALFPRDQFGFQEEHCAEECFPGWR